MRIRTLSTAGLLFAAFGVAITAYSQSFLTNGLAGYYPFDGNANDASGNGNNGVVHGAILTSDRFGVPNRAYQFNGTNSWIALPETFFGPSIRGFTLSAWITTDAGNYNDNEKILHKSSNNGQVDFSIQAGNLTFGPKLAVSGWIQASAPVPLNKTSHLVGVYARGQQAQLYINGALVNAMSLPNEDLFEDSTYPLHTAIGIYDYASTPFDGFHGVIDDVRVYTNALSALQVQQLYQSEAGPCVPHPAAASASIVNGFVVGATITDPGCGYTNTPLVLIQGGGGTGATGTAVVSNGSVYSITITAAGSGYTSAPNIYIYPPLGFQIVLVKAVKPVLTYLFPGVNYQLQVSSDMNTWTNQGAPFTATNSVMDYQQYFDVGDWSQLFFRVQVSP